MLDALRAASQNWLGRIIMGIVMGLLILAFGFWGIADIFRGFGSNDLARVGSDTISVEAYRFAYQTELQRLQQQQKRAITNEEARQMGVDRDILSRLVSDSVLDQVGQHLGLALSDRTLAEQIVQDPAFKGPDGKFDRQYFENRLQDMGYTEQRFVKEERRDYLHRQILAGLTYGLTVPKSMTDQVARFYGETRSIDFISLPKASVNVPKPPTDADLKAYYDAHQPDYRTREYRKLIVLAATLQGLSEDLAKQQPISDAELKRHYEDVKAQRFTDPEKRHIEQIAFPDQAAAEAASQKLASGETFDALIAERKLTPKDVDLGTIARNEMVDKAIADAAFALPEGKVSAPIKGQFGWVILRDDKIVPSSVIPFERVELPLRQEMGLVRAHREINKIHDQVEDQRSAGKSLSEAAKAVGLSVRKVDAVTREGYDKQAKPITDLPDEEALLKAAFASDVGVDNEPLTMRDGGTVWFEVAGIDPAHQQSFDEVKSSVQTAWTDAERAKALTAQAVSAVEKLDKGETLAALATETKATVQHKDGIKRSGGPGLTQEEVAQIFDRKVGAAGSASDAGGDRIVFKVADAKLPPVDPKAPELAKTLDDVKMSMEEDIVAQYLGQWEHQLGVSLNQQALRTAISSE